MSYNFVDLVKNHDLETLSSCSLNQLKNFRDDNGSNLLHIAVQIKNNNGIVRFLLESCGICLMSKNNLGQTVIEISIEDYIEGFFLGVSIDLSGWIGDIQWD